MAQFTEVTEADAPQNIREIYADIRACLGAPMVNLVYRHMATIPGCLQWGWGTLRPLFASGMLPEAATGIVRNIELPPVVEIPRNTLDAAVTDKKDQSAVIATLDGYNLANPMNLIGLEVLRLSLTHGPAGTLGPMGEIAASDTPSATKAPILPEMVNPALVRPEVARQLAILASQGTGEEVGVVPSLYRHLVHWPQLLRLIAQSTDDLFEHADFNTLCFALKTQAAEAARDLPRPDPGLPPPNKAQSDGLMALIDFFPTAICRMIVIGAWLRRAMPV